MKKEKKARICIYCGKPEYEIERMKPKCYYFGLTRGYHEIANVEFSKAGLAYHSNYPKPD